MYLLTIGLEKMKGAIPQAISIDDVTDQFNRNTMTRVMVLFSILSQFNQLLGANISCLGFTKYSKEFAEQFCWTQGIYTNKRAYDMPKEKVPYPGIAPCIRQLNPNTMKISWPCSDEVQYKEKVFHSWYQWVPFYFMAVAVAYYAPYVVLKGTKLNRIKPLINLLKDENNINAHPKLVVKKIATWLYNEVVYPRYASSSVLSRFWADYGLVFGVIGVKFLYFAVALGHMTVTARMFKIGNWITFGVLFGVPTGLEGEKTTHVKDVLFPKVVACHIVKWGATGTEPETGMCTLALNVMNQYLFLVMWYFNVVLIFLNLLSWLLTIFKLLNPSVTHKWIINSSMMQHSHDFSRMFGYIGPSGRIVVAKLSESMSGYLLSKVSAKLVRKIDNLQKSRECKSPMDFYRVEGQPSELARQPLMDAAAMAFVPQGMPNQAIKTRPRSKTMS